MSDGPRHRRRSDPEPPFANLRFSGPAVRVWSWSAVRDRSPVEIGLYRRDGMDAGAAMRHYVTRVEIGGCAIELGEEEAFEFIRWIRDAVQDASSRGGPAAQADGA